VLYPRLTSDDSSVSLTPAEFYRPGVPLRSQRIPLRVPVRYHVIGDAWYEGWTENVSRTGALVRTAETVPLGAEVDIILTLPTGIVSDLGGETICTGAIVRLIDAAEGQSPGFAVVFRRCRPTVAGRAGTARQGQD
jgi:hypothetical protein